VSSHRPPSCGRAAQVTELSAATNSSRAAQVACQKQLADAGQKLEEAQREREQLGKELRDSKHKQARAALLAHYGTDIERQIDRGQLLHQQQPS
jgi:hypothetical protein